jgi:SAM-dependent methyltransferase
MPKTAPFQHNVARYEAWFPRHRFAFASEVEAIRALLPPGRSLEVGCGTGRFAAALSVSTGVEPAPAMRRLARRRGIDAVDGVAEALPFPDASFDVVLMVTVICFLDDVDAALREAHRVLRPGGHLVVAFVDRDSPLGRTHQASCAASPFYAEATFLSAAEVAALLTSAGFERLRYRQTIFTSLREVQEVQPSRPGHGQGSFVVVRADRP